MKHLLHIEHKQFFLKILAIPTCCVKNKNIVMILGEWNVGITFGGPYAVKVSFCNTHVFKPYHTPRGSLIEIYDTNVCMYYIQCVLCLGLLCGYCIIKTMKGLSMQWRYCIVNHINNDFKPSLMRVLLILSWP
jgi:hypothetical protein